MKDYMDEADALIREYECDHPLPERLIAAALRAARDDGLEEATTRIRELEAEIERLRAAQQWQTMETAPVSPQGKYGGAPDDARRVLFVGPDRTVNVGYVLRDDRGEVFGATDLYLSEGIGWVDNLTHWKPAEPPK